MSLAFEPFALPSALRGLEKTRPNRRVFSFLAYACNAEPCFPLLSGTAAQAAFLAL